VAGTLAGLRANEARCLQNKFGHVFTVEPASEAQKSGLSINVMYTIDDKKKRAVGFKLSDGMEVAAELAPRFKFAKQKSRLAGTNPRFVFRNQGRVLTELWSRRTGRID
jgi:hypothetical protein